MWYTSRNILLGIILTMVILSVNTAYALTQASPMLVQGVEDITHPVTYILYNLPNGTRLYIIYNHVTNTIVAYKYPLLSSVPILSTTAQAICPSVMYVYPTTQEVQPGGLFLLAVVAPPPVNASAGTYIGSVYNIAFEFNGSTYYPYFSDVVPNEYVTQILLQAPTQPGTYTGYVECGNYSIPFYVVVTNNLPTPSGTPLYANPNSVPSSVQYVFLTPIVELSTPASSNLTYTIPFTIYPAYDINEPPFGNLIWVGIWYTDLSSSGTPTPYVYAFEYFGLPENNPNYNTCSLVSTVAAGATQTIVNGSSALGFTPEEYFQVGNLIIPFGWASTCMFYTPPYQSTLNIVISYPGMGITYWYPINVEPTTEVTYNIPTVINTQPGQSFTINMTETNTVYQDNIPYPLNSIEVYYMLFYGAQGLFIGPNANWYFPLSSYANTTGYAYFTITINQPGTYHFYVILPDGVHMITVNVTSPYSIPSLYLIGGLVAGTAGIVIPLLYLRKKKHKPNEIEIGL